MLLQEGMGDVAIPRTCGPTERSMGKQPLRFSPHGEHWRHLEMARMLYPLCPNLGFKALLPTIAPSTPFRQWGI